MTIELIETTVSYQIERGGVMIAEVYFVGENTVDQDVAFDIASEVIESIKTYYTKL